MAGVLYLKSLGTFKHFEIMKIMGVSKPTLVSYLKLYKKQCFEDFLTLNYREGKSDLYQYEKILESHFREHPVQSIVEAQKIIN